MASLVVLSADSGPAQLLISCGLDNHYQFPTTVNMSPIQQAKVTDWLDQPYTLLSLSSQLFKASDSNTGYVCKGVYVCFATVHKHINTEPVIFLCRFCALNKELV